MFNDVFLKINTIKISDTVESDFISLLEYKDSLEIYNKFDYNKITINKKQKKIITDSTENIYAKPWIKLDKLQKINRLMAYVKSLKLNYDEENDLKKILIESLNDKKMIKKTEIIYDELKGIIIEITDLHKNSDNKFYIGKDISNLNIIKTENINKMVFKKLDIKNLLKHTDAK